MILTREDERQKKIESALEEMMIRTKERREEIRPLYIVALESVKRSPTATAALKEYLVVWNE